LKYQNRVVVPAQKALTQELLYLYHDDQFGGHWGIGKTKELLERKFYWQGLLQDIKDYVGFSGGDITIESKTKGTVDCCIF
jgi:hypothetical protein